MNGEWIRGGTGWVICLLALAAVALVGRGMGIQPCGLVVGNSGYAEAGIPPLANPVNDARLMTKALETSGFEVRLVTDADQAAMKAAIEAFGKQLKKADEDSVGLFYYAGHGVEVERNNYLIPLGADIESEVEFKTDAVPADWVLSWMAAAGNRLNIVILDACRNNPFEGRYRGGSGQGLAKMAAPSGTWIAYSAAPGRVALDGEGDNSPYTAALAKTLVEPGLKIEEVFKRVRVAVEEATDGEQTPWEGSSLRGDFHFVAQVEEPPSPEPQPKIATDTKPSKPTTLELAARAYEAAERVHTDSAYQLVVDRFPDTFYAALASEQLVKLKSAPTPPTPPPPSAEEVEVSLQLNLQERQRVQIGLRGDGINPGSADGKFGKNTRNAIRGWQRKRGYEATGYLTKGQAEAILAQTTPAALLRPKCSELPGQYVGGDNHAECWEEIANRPGCFLWRTHYHSDQSTKWTGECRAGIAEGHGVYSVSAGSDHSAYEGTGILEDGKANGRWIDTWGSGSHYKGEYRDGRRHGQGTYSWADGSHYEGEYRDDRRYGWGTYSWADGSYEGEWQAGKPNGWGVRKDTDGDVYQGNWTKGCIWMGDGRWATIKTSKKAPDYVRSSSGEPAGPI